MSSGGSSNNNAHLSNQRPRYPTVDLSDETYEQYMAVMHRLLADALAADLRKSTIHRALDVVRDTDEWSVYHRELPPRRHEYICFGKLKTTLSAIQAALYTKDSFEFRSVCALLYPAHIQDAALLQVVHSRTLSDRDRFFGVKFVSLNAPSGMDEKSAVKEFLYAEYSGMCVDAHGVSTFFVLTCPLSATQGLRANAGCVKLYRQQSPFVVEVTTRAIVVQKQLDGRGSRGATNLAMQYALSQGQLMYWKTLDALIPRGLAKDLLSLPHEATLPESRRLATGPFAQAWGHSHKCVTCQKAFHLFRPKHHCRHCGWSMCGNCKTVLPCVDRSRDVGVLVSSEKFCKSCLVQARLEAYHEPPAWTRSVERSAIDAFEAIQLYDPYERNTEEILELPTTPTNQLVEFNGPPRGGKAATYPPYHRNTVTFDDPVPPRQREPTMVRLYDVPANHAPSNQMDLLADFDHCSDDPKASHRRPSMSLRPSFQRY